MLVDGSTNGETPEKKEERRKLRNDQRALRETIQFEREQLTSLDGGKFMSLCNENIELMKRNSSNLREMAQSTTITRELSEIGKELVSKHLSKSEGFDSGQYCDNIATMYRSSLPDGGIDWLRLGKQCTRFLLRVPAVGFLNGAIECERERKVRQKRKRDEIAETVHADDSMSNQNGLNETHTFTKNVTKFKRLVTTKQNLRDSSDGSFPLSLYECLLIREEDSLPKVVENTFVMGHLLKEGLVRMKGDETEGVRVKLLSSKPEGEEHISPKRCIITLSHDILKAMQAKLKESQLDIQ